LLAIRHEANVNNEFTIFTGTANPALARTIARELATQVGAPVSWIDIPTATSPCSFSIPCAARKKRARGLRPERD
jgi:hypothetical protein